MVIKIERYGKKKAIIDEMEFEHPSASVLEYGIWNPIF